MKKLKLWSGLLTLFLSGVLLGGAATWVVWEHRALGFLSGHELKVEKLIMRKLNHHLGLNESQEAQIQTIVCRTFGQLVELRSRFRPEREQIIDQGAATIRAELSPEQQRKFDILVVKRKEIRAKREAGLEGSYGNKPGPCD